jgi:hypothetical protein
MPRMSARVSHSRNASWLRAPLASLTEQNCRLFPKMKKDHVSVITLCPAIEPPFA